MRTINLAQLRCGVLVVKKPNKMERLNLTYCLHLNPKPKTEDMIEILVSIQQARFDKKNHGEGLSIQEEAELIAITNLFHEDN